MKDTLAIADVEPRYSSQERASLENYIENQLSNSLCKAKKEYGLLDYAVTHECLTRKDVAVIARYEGELKVRESSTEMDMVFPCKTCSEYLYLVNFQEETRGNYLLVWWAKQRASLSKGQGVASAEHRTWSEFVREVVLPLRA